jgi:hypothetical protein
VKHRFIKAGVALLVIAGSLWALACYWAVFQERRERNAEAKRLAPVVRRFYAGLEAGEDSAVADLILMLRTESTYHTYQNQGVYLFREFVALPPSQPAGQLRTAKGCAEWLETNRDRLRVEKGRILVSPSDEFSSGPAGSAWAGEAESGP